MAKSLVQVRAEIIRLQRSFDAVLATMRKDIAFHGLTVEDLFGPASAAPNSALAHAGPAKSKASSAPKPSTVRAAKYGDASGNVWGGMGKRPAWLVAAMASGKTKESFLLSAAQPAVAAKAPVSAPAKKAPAAQVVPSKAAAPATKKTSSKAMPGKAAAPVKMAVAAKALPAKKAALAKPVAKVLATVSSKKPRTKTATAKGKPSAVAEKAAASAKAPAPKTAAEVAPTQAP